MTENGAAANVKKTRYDAEWNDEATKRLNMLIDLVCSAYGLDYNGLADAIGVNRGWFTRYRNGGMRKFGFMAVVRIVDMAGNLTRNELLPWVFVKQPAQAGDQMAQGRAESTSGH